MKLIDKNRRLPKADYDNYREWLAETYQMCQICNQATDDTHHVLFGAYKDDRTLVCLCRECHSQAHKHKTEWQDKLLPIAKENWKNYKGDENDGN